MAILPCFKIVQHYGNVAREVWLLGFQYSHDHSFMSIFGFVLNHLLVNIQVEKLALNHNYPVILSSTAMLFSTRIVSMVHSCMTTTITSGCHSRPVLLLNKYILPFTKWHLINLWQ